MKKYIKNILFSMIVVGIVIGASSSPTVYAWGDNGGGRESYTVEEIDNGAIGDTDPNGENYPGTIVFNSISDSVIGNEKNFVAARECIVQADGRCNSANSETIWNADEIEVIDGQVYILRAYIHNDNPNGTKAIAEDTKVAFSIPSHTAKEIEVNGLISSSSATPSEYWDHVKFVSNQAFHLEYVYGSALLTNQGIGKGGISLGDEVVTQASNGGALIGYDALDGRIPGCYEYDGFVTIQVKAVFDDFMVETKVRHAGEKEWQDTINAEVGDKVEFQIRYTNTSKLDQMDVVLRDVLPSNLRYVPGSIKIKNSNFLNGGTVNGDALVGNNGLKIGDHAAGAGTVVMFTAEVVDDNLAPGSNTMVNWGRATVGTKVLQDYARVVVQKRPKFFIPIVVLLSTGIIVCTAIIIRLVIKIIKFNKRK